MPLQFYHPLRTVQTPAVDPEEQVRLIAAAITRNTRAIEEFINTSVVREESTGIVNLPAGSQVNGTPIDVDGHTHLEADITDLPGHSHTESDISDLHSVPYVAVSSFVPEPSKTSTSNIHGELNKVVDAAPLNSVPTDITFSMGIGKIIVVVNAGSDVAGTITVTGTSVNRDTGAESGADTDTLVVDAVTTDSTTTDANSNNVWDFTGAYITDKWFTGSITLSTTDLTLTDVDVYTVAFEQWNDTPSYTIDTLDATIYCTNVAAEFDCYLFTVKPTTGDKVDIDKVTSVHVGAVGTTAVANRWYRLRRSNLAETLDGSSEGFFVTAKYSNSPSYVEDATIKVWAQQQ